MPKISIIMAVYNEQNTFLTQSISSILNQSYIDFEFIIINDGSDSTTTTLLNNTALQDKRIVLFQNKKNIGLTKSLNIAILKARGEFIARMDSDDIAFHNRLLSQINFLTRHKLDLLGANCNIIDNNGTPLKKKRLFPPKNYKKRLYKGNFFTHSTLFGTKKVFSELYNERFRCAQDYEFLLRVLGNDYKLGYLTKSILAYRFNINGISAKKAKQQELFAIWAKLLAVLKYGYSPLFLLYLPKAFVSLIIPYSLKHFIIYKLLK